MLGASLRRSHTNGFPSLVGEPLLNQGGVFEIGRDEDFSRWLPVLVVELLDSGMHQFLIGRCGRLRPEEIFPSDQQAAAHEQNLEIDRSALSRQPDHILIGYRSL